MGMTYQRGNVWWIKYYRNGKHYRETTRSSQEADAKRLLKKREGEISEGKLPGIYFDKVRFDELAKGFLRDYEINQKRSLNRAQLSVRHLEAFFGGMRIPDITTPRIQAYIEKRIGQDAANATINRELAALKRMLQMGAQQTPPQVNRVPHIPMLKEDNVRKGFFEYDAFLALREALPDYLKGFATFAYKTGWRVSEIQKLTWAQVDLEQGIARAEVGETKNKEGRTVYLDEELKEIFHRQWEARKESGKLTPYVFPNKKGKDRIRNFCGAWESGCKAAGLWGFDEEKGKEAPTRKFHDFRRTAVRDMSRAGVPDRVTMMITGHKTRSVFDRYNIVSDGDLRMAAAKREAYQKGLSVTAGTISGTMVNFGKEKRRKESELSSRKTWCRGPESNRHGLEGPRDFKSLASANSATPATTPALFGN